MNLIFTAILLAIVDIPWLFGNMSTFQKTFMSIQGSRPLVFRVWAGIPVYLALAYLVSKAKSIQESWFIGASTFAVYDFTMLATLKDYPVWLAIADTIWGGTLLALTRYLHSKILI